MTNQKAIMEIERLQQAAKRTADHIAFKILTAGQTYVDEQWMYLDRDKYSGKGRPKKSDYVRSNPLYCSKDT